MITKSDSKSGNVSIISLDADGNRDGFRNESRVMSFEEVDQKSVNGDKHAPNPYDFSVTEIRYPQGSRLLYDASNKLRSVEQGCLGLLYDYDFIVADQGQALYNSAVSELNKRARGELDLSVSALEYHQVLKMIKGAGSIRSYLGNTIKNAARRGRKPTGETTLKALARDSGGNWLQWQLGLRPLLSDFHDVVKEVNTRVVLNTMRIRAKRTGPIAVSEWSSLDSDVKKFSTVNLKGVQGVDIRVQFRPVDSFNALRYASLNPVGWAWELMPLSFVVDWFYNIGATIRDTETAVAYNNTFDSGYITYLKAVDGYITTAGRYVQPFGAARYDCSSYYRNVSFQRQVLGSWPFPSLPTFKSQLGGDQLLTAAALLAQLLKS